MSDYMTYFGKRSEAESRLDECDFLFETVYAYIESMVADIDATRPTIEELEAGTARSDELVDRDIVDAMREVVHDIVRAALVILK